MRSLAGLAWYAGSALFEPAVRLLLDRRRRAGKEIPERIAERRGFGGARPPGRLLWVHAASVGESNAVLPVLSLLARQREPPSVLLTTGTASSARLLQHRLPELGLAGLVRHRMVPLDVPRWVERFLHTWRPDAAAFVESELWPNMLAALRQRRVPAALINARLSDRSARRWSHLPGLASEMLGGFVTIWARSEADARHLARLGRPADAIGDLKGAAAAPGCDPNELAALQAELGDRPLWLAASTHPGEEELVAEAHALLCRQHDRLLTIVAPRHPERGAAIAHVLGGAPKRSVGQPPPKEAGFWVCDTLGELGLLYRLAPVVLLGRSFADTAAGGQNPIEPARLGCAIITGPLTGNFAAAFASLHAADALTVVHDAPSLAAAVGRLLHDPAGAGERARQIASLPSDLLERTARMLAGLVARTR